MDNAHETAKHVTDGLSALVTVAALTEFLPPVAALLTIIWTAMRIYDWIHRKIKNRRTKHRRALDVKD